MDFGIIGSIVAILSLPYLWNLYNKEKGEGWTSASAATGDRAGRTCRTAQTKGVCRSVKADRAGAVGGSTSRAGAGSTERTGSTGRTRGTGSTGGTSSMGGTGSTGREKTPYF